MAALAAGVASGVIFIGLAAAAILGNQHLRVLGTGVPASFAPSGTGPQLRVAAAVLTRVGSAVIGGLLIAWMVWLSRASWVVAVHGFSGVRPSELEMVAWSEITAFREDDVDDLFPVLTFLAWILPKRGAAHDEVSISDGREYCFSDSTVHSVVSLGRIFRQVAQEQGIPRRASGVGAR